MLKTHGKLPVLAVLAFSAALVLVACSSGDDKTSTASNGNPASNGQRPACYPDCRRANLDGVDLDRVNLDGIDLTQASLQQTRLYGASLRGATLVQARIIRSSLGTADLTNADLSSADLSRSSLRGANLTGANLKLTRYFQTTCPDGTQTAPPASKPARCVID